MYIREKEIQLIPMGKYICPGEVGNPTRYCFKTGTYYQGTGEREAVSDIHNEMSNLKNEKRERKKKSFH